LESKGSSLIDSTETIANLCRRPELSLTDLLTFDGFSEQSEIKSLLEDEVALRQVEIDLKYEGYLKRQEEMIAKLEKYEDHKIPLTLNYSEIKALSAESREKLKRYKPRSIGQASRISGVTPSDISVLLVYLKR
jgi:tRNA uridine 5-carboxymethylaminomethyl modification enzyme